MRSTQLLLRQYRIAQVTENLVNAVLTKRFFLIFLSFTIIGQICSVYIIFTSWSYLSVGIMMLFLLLGFNFCTIIYIFLHSLCYPNVSSTQFVKIMRKSKSARSLIVRKFLNSCPPLKVGMGDGTFYDKLTSFKICQFCVERFINLLIMN